MIELIIIIDPDLGYLPTVKHNGEEVYRGEFKRTMNEACWSTNSIVGDLLDD